MLEFVMGANVSSEDELEEGYTYINDNKIIANVNASKIIKIVEDYINIHKNLFLFFSLKIPAIPVITFTDNDSSQKKIKTEEYIIDCITPENCMAVIENYGELLVDDGLCTFSIGSLESSNQLTVSRYNIVTIEGVDTEKFSDFLDIHGIKKNDSLITAFKTFSEETPGTCSVVEKNDLNIYDLPELLAPFGMHAVEIYEKNAEKKQMTAMQCFARALNIMGPVLFLCLIVPFLKSDIPLWFSWPSYSNQDSYRCFELIMIVYYVFDLIIHILAVKKDGLSKMIKKGIEQFFKGALLFFSVIYISFSFKLMDIQNKMYYASKSPDGSTYIIEENSNRENSMICIRKSSSIFSSEIISERENIEITHSDIEVSWIDDKTFNLKLTPSWEKDKDILYYCFDSEKLLVPISEEEYCSQKYVKTDKFDHI